jgi:hypothetical protein
MLKWNGCYGRQWVNAIVPDAFEHPAKFSRNLIERIYEYAIEQGYIKTGERVGDPFGGVALGAWPALRRGINWIGVELESKFVTLGNANLALWNERYGASFSPWGTGILEQGDSRQFAEIVRERLAAVVSSPPYSNSTDGHGKTAQRGIMCNESMEPKKVSLAQCRREACKRWFPRRRSARLKPVTAHPTPAATWVT